MGEHPRKVSERTQEVAQFLAECAPGDLEGVAQELAERAPARAVALGIFLGQAPGMLQRAESLGAALNGGAEALRRFMQRR